MNTLAAKFAIVTGASKSGVAVFPASDDARFVTGERRLAGAAFRHAGDRS